MSAVNSSCKEEWCVVTGGRGFAARHLVEKLLHEKLYRVRISDLKSSIELDPEENEGILGQSLRSKHAEYVSADLRNPVQVTESLKGAVVVFHMAAPDSSINNHLLHHSVNVQGTKNIIHACSKLHVKRLIYTSSPSVVFDGIHDIVEGDESLPYPSSHIDSYSSTKAQAEALVMDSNGVNGLRTCCIRPSSIFGPKDKLFIPSLVAAARSGRSKFIIGDGENMCDFTFVENVAHAHICADRALASTRENVADSASGKAYFVTNMHPIKFWDFVSLVLDGLGYEKPRIKIPVLAVLPVAHIVALIYRILSPYGIMSSPPQLTPSRVKLLSCGRTFSCLKANLYLGYTPVVSLKDGLRRTLESFNHLRNECENEKKNEYKNEMDRQSRASIFLGNGWIAYIFLWRDLKITLSFISLLLIIYYNFVIHECTTLSAASVILVVAIIILFIHGNLPQKMFGYEIYQIRNSSFFVSKETSVSASLMVTSFLKKIIGDFNLICRGGDWKVFLKAVVLLLVVSCIGSIPFKFLFPLIFLSFFIFFPLYDKYEEEIDHMVIRVCCRMNLA